MTRVLVTGATGFIGFHLVKLLSRAGLEVSCLVRRSSNIERLKVCDPRFCFGDIRDSESLDRAVRNKDLVFHLAGLTRSLKARDLYAVNGTGTSNVVRSCLKPQTPPTVVAVSSLAAAGPAPRDRLRVETDRAQPVSHYGKSKLLGEQLAIRNAINRVPLTIARPPIVFGEGDRDCFALFAGIVQWGVHLVPTFRDYRFSLIHAEDLATGLHGLAQNGKRVDSETVSTGTYFVSSAEHPTYARLGQLIGHSVGRKKVRIMHSAGCIVKAIAATNQLIGWIRRKQPTLNVDKAREAVAGSWTCSNEKICRETGFNTTRTLVARLRQTAQWYESRGWLKTRHRPMQTLPGWRKRQAS